MGADIVVVEDDPAAGTLLSEIMAAAGFSTEVVRDGSLALAVVKAQRPRLLILDLLLPGLDGFSILKKVKRDLDLRGMRVVIVSGKAFQKERERAARAGADLFIAKPFDVSRLSQQLVSLLNPPPR